MKPDEYHNRLELRTDNFPVFHPIRWRMHEGGGIAPVREMLQQLLQRPRPDPKSLNKGESMWVATGFVAMNGIRRNNDPKRRVLELIAAPFLPDSWGSELLISSRRTNHISIQISAASMAHVNCADIVPFGEGFSCSIRIAFQSLFLTRRILLWSARIRSSFPSPCHNLRVTYSVAN